MPLHLREDCSRPDVEPKTNAPFGLHASSYLSEADRGRAQAAQRGRRAGDLRRLYLWSPVKRGVLCERSSRRGVSDRILFILGRVRRTWGWLHTYNI